MPSCDLNFTCGYSGEQCYYERMSYESRRQDELHVYGLWNPAKIIRCRVFWEMPLITGLHNCLIIKLHLYRNGNYEPLIKRRNKYKYIFTIIVLDIFHHSYEIERARTMKEKTTKKGIETLEQTVQLTNLFLNINESMKFSSANRRFLPWDVPKPCQNRHKSGYKDADACNFFLEMSTTISRALISEEKQFIYWLTCHMRDFTSVTRCYKHKQYENYGKTYSELNIIY